MIKSENIEDELTEDVSATAGKTANVQTPCAEILDLLASEAGRVCVSGEGGKHCGTLHDLDIRVGLLSGLTLASPLGAFLSHKSNRPDNDAGTDAGTHVIDALIMAGGFGKRLGEVTKMTPKPLLKIGERHIVEIVLERLKTVPFGRTFMSIYHLSEQFQEFAKTLGPEQDIDLIFETEPLGTAGAISMVPDMQTNHLMVMNADVLSDVSLSKIWDFHLRFDCDMTLAVVPHEIKVPYGVVKFGGDGGFSEISEKPTYVSHVLSGIYFLSPRARGLISEQQRIDMPDLIELASKSDLSVKVFPVFEYWVDVGDVDSLDRAQKRYLNDRKPSGA